MSVDGKPEADAGTGEERLPARARPAGADAARARMLERIVPGGVAGVQPEAAETIGGHRLVRRLGRGGMGEVWEADRDGETVAIKVLRAQVAAHEPTRKRFLREARTAASVRHPGIVRIFDVGSTEAGTPFIVMERLEGRPLEELVREHGALPWECAREILLQIADALGFAHSRGVVHRDLKPANVMVRGGLDAPRCAIIDFGLARREVITSESEALSRTGEVFGSPPFMSPEQFRGDATDARSDVYSFGCLMFWVLTGRRPFAGEKIGELMYLHLFAPAPDPTGMRCPEVLEPALASITLRALRKAPEHRFATMDELAAALRRLDDDPRPVPVPREDAIGAGSVAAPAPGRRSLPWIVAGVAAAIGVYATARSVQDPALPSVRGSDPALGSSPAAAAAEVPREPAAREVSRTGPAVASDPVAEREGMTSGDDGGLPPPEAAAPAPRSTPSPRPAAHARDRKPKARVAREPHPDDPAPPVAVDPAPDSPASELPPNPFRSSPSDGAATTP